MFFEIAIVADADLEREWEIWGGASEFVHSLAEGVPDKCGICIFRKGAVGELAAFVRPFFDAHGSEANVFEYDPHTKKFVRINADWLAAYYHHG